MLLSKLNYSTGTPLFSKLNALTGSAVFRKGNDTLGKIRSDEGYKNTLGKSAKDMKRIEKNKP